METSNISNGDVKNFYVIFSLQFFFFAIITKILLANILINKEIQLLSKHAGPIIVLIAKIIRDIALSALYLVESDAAIK